MALNFAHRGFKAQYPENTMLAFKKAVEAGCHGIELDVQLTRDGGLVIIHDEDTRRTTGRPGPVGRATLEELRMLDAGEGEKIPTLEEYLDWVAGEAITTNIELKNSICRYEGMEEKVIEAVESRGLGSRVILSSFNHYSMQKCKQLAPQLKCGLLYDCWLLDAGAYAQKYGMDFVHPHFGYLAPDIVAEFRQSGVGVNTWTVNERADMERMLALGVDAIITNDPALLAEVLETAN